MAPNEPRMGRGSEGGHLFWFCHCGGTVQARSREGGGGGAYAPPPWSQKGPPDGIVEELKRYKIT